MNAIVELKNLNKTIKGKHIIKDVNLSLYPGQITGFLGPNGAGKTTTIRMMTGLMAPTSGDVMIDGQSITKNYEKAISQVGVIVENPEMYKFMTGYKNLQHFANMHPNISKQRIDEVIKQVGLEKRINEKVSTYSLGMRQRLGLAQALLHKPKFLILDEPTNGLDPAGIKELRVYLRQIAEKEQVSVIVSSHLLSEIELMCDRIAIIQNGVLTDIREMNQPEESYYLFDIQEDASTILTENNYEFTLDQSIYKVKTERAQVPEIIALLAHHKLAIFSVIPFHESLEDQFLAMTGGGQIDQTNQK
ncbi:ABC transporter ATP-binding protein [Kurthia sibirica]|uniref:Bacitracin ABC transporter ATP-binding protein n=1 Tax=Kurthia sibirica TaxID=202750 RepID=A0A2U3ANF2_9BACL|nr:ABC transporter ATP-binding protein [Kurthia sibirica]PWI26073.1 bacitracin ABC transporter ATP-binding protein [Kurthia sibirica]GEK34776.1 putative ABC transporter ATP-binding protein YhcH [Kurthia sibirica]